MNEGSIEAKSGKGEGARKEDGNKELLRLFRRPI